MAREYYVGIDPGAKGFACIYEVATNKYEHFPLFDGKRLNPKLLSRLDYIVTNHNVMAVIESVHALHGQGVSSSFSFGQNFGMVLGALEALDVPYSTAAPGRWQGTMWESCDKAPTTKLTSYSCARRLLPNMDFRRSERCKTFDDNLVDATLICLYAQRKQL